MNGGFNFRNREDIESVLRLIRGTTPAKRNSSRVDPRELIAHSIIAMTPSGGIPAKTGTTAGKASCAVYFINESDEVVPFVWQGDPLSIDVYHVFDGDDVPGDTFIQAKRISGRWVADSRAC